MFKFCLTDSWNFIKVCVKDQIVLPKRSSPKLESFRRYFPTKTKQSSSSNSCIFWCSFTILQLPSFPTALNCEFTMLCSFWTSSNKNNKLYRNYSLLSNFLLLSNNGSSFTSLRRSLRMRLLMMNLDRTKETGSMN